DWAGAGGCSAKDGQRASSDYPSAGGYSAKDGQRGSPCGPPAGCSAVDGQSCLPGSGKDGQPPSPPPGAGIEPGHWVSSGASSPLRTSRVSMDRDGGAPKIEPFAAAAAESNLAGSKLVNASYWERGCGIVPWPPTSSTAGSSTMALRPPRSRCLSWT